MNDTELDALAEKILADLAKALKTFGEYSFDDKGADEVMDYAPYTAKLAELPNGGQAGRVLKKVADGRRDGRGQALINEMVCSMDGLELTDEWWQEMVEVSGAEY